MLTKTRARHLSRALSLGLAILAISVLRAQEDTPKVSPEVAADMVRSVSEMFTPTPTPAESVPPAKDAVAQPGGPQTAPDAAVVKITDVEPQPTPAATIVPITPVASQPTPAATIVPITPVASQPTPATTIVPITPVASQPTPAATIVPITPVALQPTPAATIVPITPVASQPTPAATIVPITPVASQPTPAATIVPITPVASQPTPAATIVPITPVAPQPAPAVATVQSVPTAPQPAPAPMESATTVAPSPAGAPVTEVILGELSTGGEAPEEKPLTSSGPASPSENVTLNLINRLVQRGILTREDAADLISQAEADATHAREQAQATQYAIEQAAAAQAAAAQAAPDGTMDTSTRVTYVPEVVKAQMRDQIKQDLMDQARQERWAAPRLLPAWVSNVHPFGDIRVRFEGDMFPEGNDITGAFPNFNAINTGQPFNTAGDQFSPQYNVDQDRYRFRLRARFGAGIDLGENFTAGFRLATGENNSPVSPNQSLGLANNGQGGNFSKYAIWLDRAFIKYQLTGEEIASDVSASFGRFDNPFFTTSEIMWDNDLGFDGVAATGSFALTRSFKPFFAGGAFPVFNSDFNFASNQPTKFKSYDKYLFAGQLGSTWDINRHLRLTSAVGYYYFYNIEGQLSSPYVPLSASDASDTDNSRPSFAQKGNTYMAIRNIVPDAANDFGTINQFQYYGLATKFQELSVAAKLDYTRFEPFVVSLYGEWVTNLAFNSADIDVIAVNNRGALDDDLSDDIGSFAGGNNAWIIGLTAGSAKLEKRGDWNIGFNYRYVESDAVVDGFTDSDFGGGGTNLQGYTLSGNLALSKNVWIGIRWMSAQSVAGPTYKEDVFQFDLNSKF